MNAMDASQKYAGCGVKSELARFCLPGAKRDPNRKLAWVNSICILFLLIGIVGSRPPVINIKTPSPIEEVIPTIIEPLPPPPTRIEARQNPEPTEQPKPEAPAVVVVTPETPAIDFSIPTIGALVVPNAIAAAPPANPLNPVTPVRNQPTSISDTGKGGDRPQPGYPKIALDLGQQGTVLLTISVDERGIITNIEVLESSGSPVLDRSALDFVKRHWILPPGIPGKIYEAPIRYVLTH